MEFSPILFWKSKVERHNSVKIRAVRSGSTGPCNNTRFCCERGLRRSPPFPRNQLTPLDKLVAYTERVYRNTRRILLLGNICGWLAWLNADTNSTIWRQSGSGMARTCSQRACPKTV
jgi:hypothetical protein